MPEVFDLILSNDPLGQLIDPQQTYVVGQILENAPIVGGQVLIQHPCGEAIPTHTPVVLVGGELWIMNNTNRQHQHCFVGFSTEAGLLGETITVENNIIEKTGWNLTPGTIYMAGPNGTLITTINPLEFAFVQIIAIAQNTEKLLIKTDYSPINNFDEMDELQAQIDILNYAIGVKPDWFCKLQATGNTPFAGLTLKSDGLSHEPNTNNWQILSRNTSNVFLGLNTKVFDIYPKKHFYYNANDYDETLNSIQFDFLNSLDLEYFEIKNAAPADIAIPVMPLLGYCGVTNCGDITIAGLPKAQTINLDGNQSVNNFPLPATLKTLEIVNCNLIEAQVDYFLTEFSELTGLDDTFSINLAGNVPPSAAGMLIVADLITAGVNVTVD